MSAALFPSTIERVERPSPEEFAARYLTPCRPVIVRGAIDHWPACTLWTPEWLAAQHRERLVTAIATERGAYDPSFRYTEERFGRCLDLLRAESTPRLALTQLDVLNNTPWMLDHIDVPYFPLESVTALNVWIGNRESRTELHWDDPANLLAALHGRKRIWLFSPDQHRVLYPVLNGRHTNWSRVDLDRPDLDRFPRFREARPIELVLEPGELLHIPPCWWHRVAHLDTMAIAVNFWTNRPDHRRITELLDGDTFYFDRLAVRRARLAAGDEAEQARGDEAGGASAGG